MVVIEGPGAAADTSATTAGRVALARETLATWRVMHVPLTWVLFALAIVHMLGALYYGTLQR